MKVLLESMTVNAEGHGKVIKSNNFIQASTVGNVEHTIRDIHDILKSYYTVARKRFVDVMCMQAVDHYLITGPTAPVGLFSPSFVSGLNADQLARIAGEGLSTKRKREELKREIGNLTEGKKILI